MIIDVSIAVDKKPFACRIALNENAIKSGLISSEEMMRDLKCHVDTILIVATDYVAMKLKMGKNDDDQPEPDCEECNNNGVKCVTCTRNLCFGDYFEPVPDDEQEVQP